MEQFAKGQGCSAIQAFAKHGHMTEIGDTVERFRTIAKSFVENPQNTLVISPDNGSRRELNNAIRTELQAKGIVGPENHRFRVLVEQQDMTGADRAWAARYMVGDVLRYSRGSKVAGIRAGSYTRVLSIDPEQNLLTVKMSTGATFTYDPRRLSGVSVYQEREQPFATGDRVRFTAPDKNLGVANRELGTIKSISLTGNLVVRLEKGGTVKLNLAENRPFDYGYAMTSHSAQGVTAERVLINADTKTHPHLVNSRFAYVAISRARLEATIYTNDSAAIEAKLGSDFSKSSALVSSRSLEPAVVRGLDITL